MFQRATRGSGPGSEKDTRGEADKLNRKAVKFHDAFSKPLFAKDGMKPGENLVFFAVDNDWEPTAKTGRRCWRLNLKSVAATYIWLSSRC